MVFAEPLRHLLTGGLTMHGIVYAALIGLLISRAFLDELKKTTKCHLGNIPHERWVAIWTTVSADLLAIGLRPYRDITGEKYLLLMIQRKASDPNRSRKLLPERAFA